MTGPFRSLMALAVFACAAAPFSHATTATFNFDTDTPFTTQTAFTDTSNGISATFFTFVGPDAGGAGFVVEPSFGASTFTGNALASQTPGDVLGVIFSQPVTSASVQFLTDDFGTPQIFALDAFFGGNFVGDQFAYGTVPTGDFFPQGTISFGGMPFDGLAFSSENDFAIDDLNVVATPEPPAITLVLLGLLLMGAAGLARTRLRFSRAALLRVAGIGFAGLGLSAFSFAASVPALLPLPAASASVSGVNGDGNPYGVAFVPRTVPTDGILKPGAVLVSNFNDINGLQGRGTSIVQVQKDGTVTPFYINSFAQSGMTGALGIFSDGMVVAGNEPSIDGTPATVFPGSLEVITRKGQLALVLNGPAVKGPWGLAIYEKGGGAASIFVSNVLNGTIVRYDVLENGTSMTVRNQTTIATDLTHRADPAAFTLGPSGLAYDAAHDLLYFANSDDNNVYSLAHAAAATGQETPTLVYSDPNHLHGPLDLVLVPTGHLLVANSDGVNTDPNQPSELVEFTPAGQFVAQYSIDPNNGGAFGLAVNYIGFGTFSIAAVDDNQNTVILRTETVN